MQTVLLAAGEGTRMRPLTEQLPKPLLPVADRPLLVHTAEAAVAAGASRLIVVVGYEGALVRDRMGETVNGVPVTFIEQTDRRGTADAVLTATSTLADGPFAVLNGDSLYDEGSLAALFDRGPAVGAYEVPNPGDYGVLHTSADGDVVTGVTEKPATPETNRINTGAYVFPAEAQGWLDVERSDRGEHELTDVLQRAAERTQVRAVTFDRWLDVGRPWELLAANEWKLGELDSRIDGAVHDDAVLRGPVVVEDGAEIDAGAVIEGPVLVREDVSVGPNAYVRGSTLLEPGVSVGHAVEIKNSVLMAGATASHLAYVGDSLLGRDVNLGAGTVVANLRHDDAEVEMTVKGERTSTGRRKFGVVLGEGVQTGVNTSLNAGVTLAGGTTTRPGEVVLKDPGTQAPAE